MSAGAFGMIGTTLFRIFRLLLGNRSFTSKLLIRSPLSDRSDYRFGRGGLRSRRSYRGYGKNMAQMVKIQQRMAWIMEIRQQIYQSRAQVLQRVKWAVEKKQELAVKVKWELEDQILQTSHQNSEKELMVLFY
ncbi:hypothetical protein NPIL_88551 [Nephila pilipes]|uniref:Uncharacterized protein n=1 Tax=Nephila pilipes TaxID=299642 RepID=A0A8X6QL08_NEPPI|nr:hypothetical protein NPIL_88551 [Nephila pilipes]